MKIKSIVTLKMFETFKIETLKIKSIVTFIDNIPNLF